VKAEVLPSTPETPSASKQGTATPAAPKKAPGRKRKAAVTPTGADNDTTEPAAKRKRAAAAAVKKAPVKKRAPKTPKIVVEDVDSESEVLAKVEQSKQYDMPLTVAVQHKLRAVDAFLDTHTSPLLKREEGSNIAIVDELDLLAALIILRVDYQVEDSRTEVCLEDAGDMMVAQLGAGKVSVDFDKTCDTERAVQAKLAEKGTGLEDVNLIELEIEMLAAKRKQLVEEEEPDAGLRFYGEHTEVGEAGGTFSSE